MAALVRFIGAFNGVSDEQITRGVPIPYRIRADALHTLLEDGVVLTSFPLRKDGVGHQRIYRLAVAR